MFDDMINFHTEIQKEHALKYAEYERLRADCPKSIQKGQRVLVAIGFLGHGFHWIRGEANVLDVADGNSKIGWENEDHRRCPDIYKTARYEYWIPNCLITAILSEAQ